jgi:hypothetical protein
MRNLLMLFAIASVSLFSCNREASDTVDQDTIFTSYELFYNANEDKTYARATFQFSNAFGTKLELTQPSEVTFNGDILTFRPALAYYEREYAGFVTSGTFEWNDLDGNVFSNAIEVHPIDYAVGIDTISRAGSFELGWQGEPLEQFEVVTVTVNGENELDAQVFATSNIGAQSIILDKDKLERLGDGPGTVFMDRSYILQPAQATGAGGLVTGRYRPENLAVYIK